MEQEFVSNANLGIRSSEVIVAKLFLPPEMPNAGNQTNMVAKPAN
jgi:hypothetical protein